LCSKRCTVGTLIFTTWWDSPAKRCQIIFSKMFVKKVFQLVQPFLGNLHSTSSNIYSYMYSMAPKICLFLFGIWVFKFRRILRWFQICGNNRKIHPEKVICQTLLQVSSIERIPLIFHTFFGCNVFLSKFFTFFSTVSKSVSNSALFWYPYFAKKKFLSHISTSLKL